MLVTSVGCLLVDLIFDVPRWPQPGHSINATQYYFEPAGKGLVQVVAISKLGARAAILAKVGDDDFGHKMQEILDHYRVDRRFLVCDREFQTGVVCVINEDSKERKEEGYIGAAHAARELREEHLSEAEELFEASDALIVNLDVGLEISLAVLNKAVKSSKPILKIFVAAPPEPIEESVLKQLAGSVDYVAVNNWESKIVLRKQEDKPLSDQDLAHEFTKLGFKNVLITEGYNGGFFSSQNSQNGQFAFKAVPVPEVGTLGFRGAKDVFVSALAFGLIHAWDLHEAIYFASVASSRILLSRELLGGIPDIHTVRGVMTQLKNSGFDMFGS